MELLKLKEKLKSYKKEDIIFTEHSKLQAFIREVDLEEVKENVVNPTKLVYAKEQEAKYKNEENMIAILPIQNTFTIDML